MMFSLSKKSVTKLTGVHPHLVAVVELAIQRTKLDFCVLEGLRTKERQAELVAKGASTTMNSRHITGHAVDLGAMVGTEIRWDWSLYHILSRAVKGAANELNIPIVWGGDWKSFPDGPHFELDRKFYA